MFRVLLVEDLEECQLIVKRCLVNAEIDLTVVETVSDALKLIDQGSTFKFDLVILDLGLPDGEGLSVLEAIRTNAGDHVPVFLLTSDTQLDSKVTAFNLGADDYLVKPISGIELRARIEMRLKKAAHQKGPQTHLHKGSLTLDMALLRASIREDGEWRDLTLTAKEFKILAILVQNEGKVFSRTDLINAVWGDAVHVLERTVDSHIFGLRKKLGTHASYVESIPNVGYRFMSEPATEIPARKANS